MSKYYLGLAFTVLIALILLILGLLGTETGSRWLLTSISRTLPGAMTIKKVEGNFISHITFNDFSYKSQTDQVIINRLDLRWQPWQLFSGTLKINNFSADGIVLALLPTNTPKESYDSIADGVKLFLKPDIDNLELTNIKVNNGESSQFIRHLQLSIQTDNEHIKLKFLNLDSDLAKLNARGTISTARGFPLELAIDWQSNLAENGNWQGTTKLSGDMVKLNIVNKQSSPFKFNLQGDVQRILTEPKLNLHGDWEKLTWPFSPKAPQIQSPKGSLQLTGLLNEYQFKIAGKLSQQFLPGADLIFDGNGSMQALKINKLDITSETGLFHLAGNLNWTPIPAFDLAISGVDFNPALLAPDLPGSLNFYSRVKGSFDPKAIQITAELNKISGHLRQKPFEAIGTFTVNGEHLKVSGLQVESGANKLAVNGIIDKNQGDLTLDINMPKLSVLWPTLAGSLEGGGRIEGGWSKPSLKLKLDGKSLKLGEQGTEHLALDIDYSSDDKKISSLNFLTEAIRAGNIQIDKIGLNGKGSLKKHDLKLDLNSPKGSLAAAVSGSWKTPAWRANLYQLELAEQNGNVWTLVKAVPLRTEQKTNGIDFALDETCVTREAAALCSKITHSENSDLNFKMTANSLPSNLLQPWLGQDTRLVTTLDGKVDLSKKNKVLAGNYRFVTAPTLIQIKNKEFQLQPSSLNGNISGDNMTVDMDLHLAAEDYVRSRLKLDIGPVQTVTGKIKVEVTDFSPLKVLLPQVNAITGKFNADLNLNGPLKKPLLQGRLDLAQTDIDSADYGFRNINLTAKVDSSQGNRLKLLGSLEPDIHNNPNSSDSINVKSLINLSADIRQIPSLKGEFSIDLPATLISVRRSGFVREINLARSTVKGQILNKTLFADLDLALPQQDYVHGKVKLVGDETQALSAQLNAAINDFKLIEAFVPEISNLKGALTADIAASGSLDQPKINAKLDFNHGGADVERVGIALREIELHAFTPVLTDDLIQVHGSVQSGGGKLRLDGTISQDPAQQRPINLTVQGKDFEVAKIPEAEVAVSPGLVIAATDAGTKITGNLAVPKAILKMQEIPENAVKVSADEIILGEEPPEENKISAPGIFADVLVMLGKNVSFAGQGLTTNLKGQLHIIKDRDKLAMQGAVNMANGKYKSYGQDLTVRKGQFVFNGPVDNPWLNVEAIRLSKDKKVTAVLNLSGSIENPQTRISSEPSLPESEALAYLVTGGPLNQVSKSEGNVLASAAISYGADQAGWLADKLGFSDFSVQQGSTLKDTLLVMGKYLTPDFYMGAKVGMFNKQAVMVLKHKLIDNLNVETQAGTSQRVKLNYEFDAN